MRRMTLGLCLAAMAAVMTASVARADSFKVVGHGANWTFNDQVYWNELAINGPVNNGTTIHSPTGHNAVSISFGLGGPGQTFTQCATTCGAGQTWSGDFLPGQHLLGSISGSNQSEGNLTLTFGQAISGIGFSIEPSFIGTFTAEITVFDGSTALGTFTRSGDSTFSAGSMQTFLGVLDLTGADITSVSISVFNCGGGPCTGGFAIGELLLQTTNQTTTPEPAGLALLGSSVLGLGFLFRRKLLPEC